MWQLFLSFRFLTAKKKHAFISVISLISVAGIAIGVAALITVLSVMSGFDNELKEKIIGLNSEILIEKDNGINNYKTISAEIAKVEGVSNIAPFINSQALISADNKTTGIIIRGIDSELEKGVTKLEKFVTIGSYKLTGSDIIAGSELAKKLGVNIGDDISLISPVTKKTYTFKIKGIFNSGMYDYDANIVFIDLADAKNIFNLPDVIGGFELKVKKDFNLTDVKINIQNVLPKDYSVRTWMEANKNLFSALKLEKIVMFIILTLIVVVAALNIASSLIMTVMEKTKDVGILRAIGATKKSIMAIFAINGMMIGLLGTALGVIFGIGISNIIKKYQFVQIPKDIYYIDKIPAEIVPSDVFIIAVSSVIITFIATIYPAFKASNLNITDALRYE